jgi:hypothetical protein
MFINFSLCVGLYAGYILKFCSCKSGICTEFCKQQFYLCKLCEHLDSSLSNLVLAFYKQCPLGSLWPPSDLSQIPHC